MSKRNFEEAKKSPFYKAQLKILNFMRQIEDIMNARHITQKELASKMGVSPAYVSRLFNCNINMSEITKEKLATALDMEISQPTLYDVNIMCSDRQSIKTENKDIHFTYNNDNFDFSVFQKSQTSYSVRIS